MTKIIKGCQHDKRKGRFRDRSMSITETIGGAERKIAVRYLGTISVNSVGITWHHSAGTEMTPNTEERARKKLEEMQGGAIVDPN